MHDLGQHRRLYITIDTPTSVPDAVACSEAGRRCGNSLKKSGITSLDMGITDLSLEPMCAVRVLDCA